MWNNIEAANSAFEAGHLIEIDGTVESYQGKAQITVEKFRIRPLAEIDITEYAVGTTGEPDEFADLKTGFAPANKWVEVGLGYRSALRLKRALEPVRPDDATKSRAADQIPTISVEEVLRKVSEAREGGRAILRDRNARKSEDDF